MVALAVEIFLILMEVIAILAWPIGLFLAITTLRDRLAR